MNDDEQCPVCGRRRILKKVCYDPNSVFYECPVCGQYEYSMENSTYEELDDKELVNQALYMTAYLYEGSDIYPNQFEPDKKIDKGLRTI